MISNLGYCEMKIFVCLILDILKKERMMSFFFFWSLHLIGREMLMLDKEMGLGCSRELTAIFLMWKVHETSPTEASFFFSYF